MLQAMTYKFLDVRFTQFVFYTLDQGLRRRGLGQGKGMIFCLLNFQALTVPLTDACDLFISKTATPDPRRQPLTKAIQQPRQPLARRGWRDIIFMDHAYPSFTVYADNRRFIQV